MRLREIRLEGFRGLRRARVGLGRTTVLGDAPSDARLTVLREADMEHCLWRNGYADVYREAAGLSPGESGRGRSARARSVIGRAVRRTSKPHMALQVLDALGREGSPGVPPPLRAVIDRAVTLARGGVSALPRAAGAGDAGPPAADSEPRAQDRTPTTRGLPSS